MSIAPIGWQGSSADLNAAAQRIAGLYAQATAQAVALENYVQSVGQSGLLAAGYTSAQADEFTLLSGYMATLAGVFLGQSAQGAAFNFGNALAPLIGPSVPLTG